MSGFSVPLAAGSVALGPAHENFRPGPGGGAVPVLLDASGYVAAAEVQSDGGPGYSSMNDSRA